MNLTFSALGWARVVCHVGVFRLLPLYKQKSNYDWPSQLMSTTHIESTINTLSTVYSNRHVLDVGNFDFGVKFGRANISDVLPTGLKTKTAS